MDLKNAGVEVPLLLIFFACSLSDPIDTNFVIYRTCYVILGYNETDCSKLGTKNSDNSTNDLEKKVEPTSNVIVMTMLFSSQLMCSLICLFVGAWSDKHGRKNIILISLLGMVANNIIKSIISFIPTLSPWFLVMQIIPNALSGGITTFIMIVLCYISDVSTEENRGMRMAVFESVIALGTLIGTISSSYYFNLTNYTGVYLTCALCAFLAFLWTCFFIKESITIIEEQGDNIFSTAPLKEMISSTIKVRANNDRTILLLLMVTLVVYIMAIMNGNLTFLFARLKFGWPLEQYTLYSCLDSSLWIVGTFVGVYILHKLLSITEIPLLIMGYGALTLSSCLRAAAQSSWYLYAAAGIHCFGGVIGPMSRSLISKIVPPDEIGKIFSLTGVMESFSMVISSFAYPIFYNYTISVFPGAFNLIGTAIFSLNCCLILVIKFLKRSPETTMTEPLIIN